MLSYCVTSVYEILVNYLVEFGHAAIKLHVNCVIVGSLGIKLDECLCCYNSGLSRRVDGRHALDTLLVRLRNHPAANISITFERNVFRKADVSYSFHNIQSYLWGNKNRISSSIWTPATLLPRCSLTIAALSPKPRNDTFVGLWMLK